MDVALAAHFKYGKTISGRGIYMKPKSERRPRDRRDGPGLDRGARVHGRRRRGRHRDREVRVLRLAQRLRGRLRDQPGARPGPDPRRRVDGHVARAVRDDRAVLPVARITAGRLHHYLMPGPLDLPEIDAVVLEIPSANGPYGMKGVGEMTANPPIPAIVNAIDDAIGVQITDLPVTPEKVLRALES